MLRPSRSLVLILAVVGGAPALAQGTVEADRWRLDMAFGAKVATDYNFRGISQSARFASVQGYVEPRFGPFYAGAWLYSVTLPTRPLAEVDLYAGLRFPIGPVTLDHGVMYYLYPRERALEFPAGTPLTPADTDFWEIYSRPSWAVNEWLTLGANVAYAPNWLATGSPGLFSTVSARIALPEGFVLSGEVGRYGFGRTNAFLGNVRLPDYALWNVGLSWTWDGLATIDLRYHGSSLSRTDCFTLTTDPVGVFSGSNRSSWCGDAVIASVAFDTTWSDAERRLSQRRAGR